MKYKTTRKAIRESNRVILRVGYGALQHLFRYTDAFAYSTRAEGWACDYYYLGDGVCVSTGYDPIGVKVPYEVTRKFDDEARKILQGESEHGFAQQEYPDALESLIDEYRAAALAAIGKEAG